MKAPEAPLDPPKTTAEDGARNAALDDFCRDLAAGTGGLPGLRLLVLHGSRARGEAHAASDWDLGFLAQADFDDGALRVELVRALGTEAVDLVDLARAGGLLRYHAARDGRLLFEARPGEHERFVVEAVRFWLDAGPELSRAFAAVLGSLG